MTMAYSSVRVQFEIGHEASVRTKKTPEGFTHDWEVFVRGADNTDIQCFVDKVVFYLHETFPKPRRVIKEPPYIVKESGYAGFVLPIDVYLKNKEEPKKISFQYDLTLQSSGPPISRVLREPRLFQNPSEDFRRKLIRGGGVGVDTPSETLGEDLKSAMSISQNKLKPIESPAKKHKSDLPLNHSFAELFGTPIRRVPETKKLPEPPKKIDDKKKSSKPYKEEKEVLKEKYLERDKSKEKPKRPPSPSLPPPSIPQVKLKDDHKKHEDKERKKEDDKKKRKEEKEKKEKTKEPDRQLEKELKKDKKESRDADYAKKLNSKPPDVKISYEKHNSEVTLDREKERLEKEKHKHRHKKKEKEKNRDKEKHRKEKEKDFREKEKEKGSKKKHEEPRDKEDKRRKSKSPSPVQIKKGPLNALLDELGSSDSASPLSEDESIPPVKPPAKIVPDTKPQPLASVPPKPKSTNSSESMPKMDDSTPNKNKREKFFNKKSKKSDKDSDKRKEKDEHRARSVSSERAEREEEEEEEKERASKEERLEKDKPDDEKVKPKDKENRKRKREKSEEKQPKVKKNGGSQSQSQSGPTEGMDGAGEELRRSDKFTKEYVAQLRDLQHRIMTLEDNAELQKVVKVIAETGQYEVTKKTFDFDLCALDMETVKRLQEFFAPT